MRALSCRRGAYRYTCRKGNVSFYAYTRDSHTKWKVQNGEHIDKLTEGVLIVIFVHKGIPYRCSLSLDAHRGSYR